MSDPLWVEEPATRQEAAARRARARTGAFFWIVVVAVIMVGVTLWRNW